MLSKILENVGLIEAKEPMPKVKILSIANEDVDIEIIGKKKVRFTTSFAHLGEFGKFLQEAIEGKNAW